jgi:hypothetical protein
MKHKHMHQFGRECCPHPDCVVGEQRKIDKMTVRNLALSIQKGEPLSPGELKRLADAALRVVN